MKQVEQGILTTTITINRNDEFGDLSRAFDRMLQQIVELIRRAELHNELERKLEIQVLQSQINPHFLYNTLGSISNVIRLGQIEKVDVVIGSLISLLEYGIDDASEKVSLRQELRNVADYIEIQNIRYNRNFNLIENIEAGLMDFQFSECCCSPLWRIVSSMVITEGELRGLLRFMRTGRTASSSSKLLIKVREFQLIK